MAAKQVNINRLSGAIITLILLTSPVLVFPQDSHVEKGIEALGQKNYRLAFESLDQALRYPAGLSGENAPRAYFFRAKARIYYYNEAILQNDQDLISDLQDSYLEAYRDLLRAFENDKTGTWSKRIDDELKSIYDGLVHYSIAYLNQANDHKSDKSLHEELLNRSLDYSQAALSVKSGYLPHDVAGQAFFNLGKSRPALYHFLRSVREYDRDPPTVPDLLMGYVYYRSALIYRYQLENNDSAFIMVGDGIRFLESEYKRAMTTPSKDYAPEEIFKQYKRVMADMTTFELDLYLNNSGKLEQGLKRFREILVQDPGNYDVRISYASLLEKVDIQQSIMEYKKAISLDSTRALPYYNIGALYYSRGADQYRMAVETEDSGKYNALLESAKENFLLSVPYLEKSLSLDPANLEAISALKNVAVIMDDPDAYEKYSEMEKNKVK